MALVLAWQLNSQHVNAVANLDLSGRAATLQPSTSQSWQLMTLPLLFSLFCPLFTPRQSTRTLPHTPSAHLLHVFIRFPSSNPSFSNTLFFFQKINSFSTPRDCHKLHATIHLTRVLSRLQARSNLGSYLDLPKYRSHQSPVTHPIVYTNSSWDVADAMRPFVFTPATTFPRSVCS